MQLKVDLGFETRDLVAGIAQSYKASELVGKTVTMLVNLEPRKIRGIVSNGMILAAHSEGRISLVCPEGGEPGSTVQ
jgi:methionyl-tRNA synthetase